jgi:nucleoside-diphosphate-sugar epimerase
MSREKQVFLVGGSGFIGKHLSLYLAKNGYVVTIYDKKVDHKYFSMYPSIKTVQMDLISQKIPDEVDPPDYIINLASIVTADRDLSLFHQLASSNLEVLLNLFDRFKYSSRLRLFIQFGSSEEYGMGDSPYLEGEREYPISPYGVVKQLTTNTVLMLYHNYGFPAMVVRPANLFGPLQDRQKFIPYVIEQLRKHAPLYVSPCKQKRDFMHVGDFSYLIGRLMNHFSSCVGEIVNVGSGKSISLRDVIEIYREALSSSSLIYYGALPYRKNEAMDLVCNIDKLMSLVDERFDYDIRGKLTSVL